MTKKSKGDPTYYYAGKKKIELVPADDLFAISESDMPEFKGLPQGQALMGGLNLIPKAQLPTASPETQVEKPRFPVFRSHGAIVIALPEIRVEETREGYLEKLDQWISHHTDDVVVVSRDEGRVVLMPASGSGQDALKIANSLEEQVGPEMAQARFIRVTQRPDSHSTA